MDCFYRLMKGWMKSGKIRFLQQNINRSMNCLVLPNKITIYLVNLQNAPVHISNVIFGIRLFATLKNNFHLAPFFTNATGVLVITKKEIEAEIRTTYDSGLMAYASVETCSTNVKICVWSDGEVQKALHTREKVWTSLLNGETGRWQSIEALRNVYRHANNYKSVDGHAMYNRSMGRKQ